MPTGQLTWLTPYESAWKAIYPESVVPFKQLARFLAPIQKAAPVERIVTELTAYLGKTPPQYLNLAKFAATFGSWATPEPVKFTPSNRWACVNHPERQVSMIVGRVALCAECRELQEVGGSSLRGSHDE